MVFSLANFSCVWVWLPYAHSFSFFGIISSRYINLSWGREMRKLACETYPNSLRSLESRLENRQYMLCSAFCLTGNGCRSLHESVWLSLLSLVMPRYEPYSSISYFPVIKLLFSSLHILILCVSISVELWKGKWYYLSEHLKHYKLVI